MFYNKEKCLIQRIVFNKVQPFVGKEIYKFSEQTANFEYLVLGALNTYYERIHFYSDIKREVRFNEYISLKEIPKDLLNVLNRKEYDKFFV